jgi:glutamate racemase
MTLSAPSNPHTPANPEVPSSPHILVFDSGVGGLSIVGEIQKKLPQAPIIYLSDNGYFPYGTKTEAELIARVDDVLHKVMNANSIDIIVIACNTASTLTLPHVRSHFKQPVVGVVPAIKPAAALTKSHVIGLLATPATIGRSYTHRLIQEYAADSDIIAVGSSELVQLAEDKLRGGKAEFEPLKKILQPFFVHPRGNEMDVLVLACTHFPLLRNEIAAQFSPHVHLIDSGEAIARRVASLAGPYDLLKLKLKIEAPKHSAIFTANLPNLRALLPQLAQFGISKVEILK